MLNYGYAIIRACLARAIVGAGLLPAFGIHHASIHNAFNLADDLIEPFRPFVDAMVVQYYKQQDGSLLTLDDRRFLTNVVFSSVRIADEIMPLMNATELCAFSLVKAMREKNPLFFKTPFFILPKASENES